MDIVEFKDVLKLPNWEEPDAHNYSSLTARGL